MTIEYDSKKRLQFRGYLLHKALYCWPLQHAKIKDDPKTGVFWCLSIADRAYEYLTVGNISEYEQKGCFSIYPGQVLSQESKVFMDVFEEVLFGDFSSDTNRAASLDEDIIADLRLSVHSLWRVINSGSPELSKNGEATLVLEEKLKHKHKVNLGELAELELFSINRVRSKDYCPLSHGFQSGLLQIVERISSAIVSEIRKVNAASDNLEFVLECLASVTSLLGWMSDVFSPELPFDKSLFSLRDNLMNLIFESPEQKSSFEKKWWNRANELFQLLQLEDLWKEQAKEDDVELDDISDWDKIEEAIPSLCLAIEFVSKGILDHCNDKTEQMQKVVCRSILAALFSKEALGGFEGSPFRFLSCFYYLYTTFDENVEGLSDLVLTDENEGKERIALYKGALLNLATSLTYRVRLEDGYVSWPFSLSNYPTIVSNWVDKYLDRFGELSNNKKVLPASSAVFSAGMMSWLMSFDEECGQNETEKKMISISMILEPEIYFNYEILGEKYTSPSAFTSEEKTKTVAKYITEYVKAYKTVGSEYDLLNDQILFASCFNGLIVDLETGKTSLDQLSKCVKSALNHSLFLKTENLSDTIDFSASQEVLTVIYLVVNVLCLLFSLDNPKLDNSKIVESVFLKKDIIVSSVLDCWQKEDDLFHQCEEAAKTLLNQTKYLSLFQAFSADCCFFASQA